MKHEYEIVPDDAPEKYADDITHPSALDIALERFSADGRTVLSYERREGGWIVKLMAAKEPE